MRIHRPTVALLELALGTLAAATSARNWLKHRAGSSNRIEDKLDLLLEERGVR